MMIIAKETANKNIVNDRNGSSNFILHKIDLIINSNELWFNLIKMEYNFYEIKPVLRLLLSHIAFRIVLSCSLF